MKKRLLGTALATMLLVVGSSSVASAVPADDYIVVFKNSTNVTSELKSWKSKRLTIRETYRSIFRGMTVRVDANQLKQLRLDPDVLFIEKDSIISVSDVQNPTPSWGIDRIDQLDTPLNRTYQYGATGQGVSIYIVDTGVLETHSEFTGRILPGYTNIDDGRGTTDCNGHGTHVAGSAAGTTYGVAKQAIIVPVRVMACRGTGTVSGIVAGLEWISGQYTAGDKAVVNMSLSGGSSAAFNNATQNLINRGITVVVAAGNSSTNACLSSPASVPQAITVAATTSSDSFASYSNWGSCVDILAPGSSITSSYHSSPSSSATLDGTSMASPHVAGAAALVLESGYKSPATVASNLIADSTRNTISSVPFRTPNRMLFTGGYSATASLTPSTQIVSGYVGSQIPESSGFTTQNLAGTLTYSIVRSDSSSPEFSATGLEFSDSTGIVSGTPSSSFIGNYTITATNGLASASSSLAIRIDPPAAQAITPATNSISGTRGVTLSIPAYSPSGSFDGTVTYSIAPELPNGLELNSDTGAITGTPSVTLPETNFTITAQGANSGSATATLTLTITEPIVNSAPDAPTSVQASATRFGRATLTWTAGSSNGSNITSQTIRVYGLRNGSLRLEATLPIRSSATNTTITGLVIGRQYRFTVSATNQFGTSPESLSSNLITARR